MGRSVTVEVDVEDVVHKLDDEALKLEARSRGFIVEATGEGDVCRRENVIECAYLAARKMPSVPRELADLFWHVHGRAL